MRMRAPDGGILEVPNDKVRWAISEGAVIEASSPDVHTSAQAPASATGVRRGRAPENYNLQWRDAAIRALPSALGAAGGLVGTGVGAVAGGLPAAGFGMAGAAAGGALGRTIEDQIETALGTAEPQTASAAAGRVLRSGAEQAALEGLGHGAMGLARAAGGSMMRYGMRPPVAAQKAALQVAGQTPGRSADAGLLAAQALKERVAGSGPVNARIDALVSDVNDLVAQAGATRRFKVTDFMGHMATLRESLEKLSDQPALRRLDKLVDDFAAMFRAPRRAGGRMGKLQSLTPTEVQDLKRRWQLAADEVYRAQQRGSVSSQASLRGQFNAARARAAREALEQIPGVAERNRRISELIPLRDAMLAAEQRHTPTPFIPAAFGGALGFGAHETVPGLLAGAAIGSLRNPTVARWVALQATRGGTQQALRQSPRLAWWMVNGGIPELAPADSTEGEY